jgi:hypothetical protein
MDAASRRDIPIVPIEKASTIQLLFAGLDVLFATVTWATKGQGVDHISLTPLKRISFYRMARIL